MNILYVSPFSHGVNVSPILDIAHLVANEGHDVHFYTVKTPYIEFNGNKSLKMAEIPGNVRMHYIKNRYLIPSVAYSFINPVTEYRDLKRIVKENNIDLVHFNFPEHLICLPLLKKSGLGVPTVLSINGVTGYDWFYGNRFIDFVGKIYFKHIASRAIRNADAVITPSSKSEKTLTSMGLNPNLTTLSQYGGCYGIDTELFKPFSCEKKAELRSKYHLPEDAFIITYAGRFVPVKRIDLLIRSFNTLKTRLKNAYLLLVGDGPEKPNLQRLARENPNIQFLNFLNQKLLSELYGASDMFVLLSSGEGNAVGVMEACSSALPSLVSDAGATSNIVKDGRNGFVTDPHEEEIIDNILKINQNHDELSKGARNIALEKFSWDSIVKNHIELYKNLISGE